ncbi:hypothetical protein ES707_02264 [subsurface metagenome]
MLGDDPHTVIVIIIKTIFLPRQLRYKLYQWSKEVGLIDRGLALYHSGRSLQAHTGINTRLGQQGALAFFVLVILDKHQVPDFRKAAAFAVGGTRRLPAAKLRAKVIVYFAAGPTGPGITGRTPEVILFAKPQYPIFRYTQLPPDMERFVVIKENSYPQALRWQFQALNNKLQSQANGLLFEVITDAEIAQHLKKGKVASVTHRFNISGAKALLT